MPTLAKVAATAPLAAAEKKKLIAKGRAAIATVLKMKSTIQSAFYAMGRALAVLHDPAMFRALGHTSFAELCNTSLAISESQASRLIEITQKFSAKDAKKLITSTKATSIISLANAMGGKVTPAGILKKGTLHLPNGQAIDVHAADAHAIDRAAKQVRARTKKPSTHGGISVSSDAKRFFTHLRAEAKRAKLSDLRVDEIAASKSEGAKMRITVGVRDAEALGRALIAASQAK